MADPVIELIVVVREDGSGSGSGLGAGSGGAELSDSCLVELHVRDVNDAPVACEYPPACLPACRPCLACVAAVAAVVAVAIHSPTHPLIGPFTHSPIGPFPPPRPQQSP